MTQPNSTAQRSTKVAITFKLTQLWEIPEDAYIPDDDPEGYIAAIMEEYLRIPGDSSLDEDYTAEAWGGWDGPVVTYSRLTKEGADSI